MERLIDSYRNSQHLHHAYFFVGQGGMISGKLKSFLEENVGIKISGNPDFWHGQDKTFTIENARQITDLQSRKDLSNGLKIFIIEAEIITIEAQNALLKVFEEPTRGTHFFIISPQDILLPTFRSRMQIISIQDLSRTALDILGMKMKERLEIVKEITDAISDENKTKQDAISLLNQIEITLHSKGTEKYVMALQICELARESLYDRGAPVKMVLEHVMLSI